LGASLLSGCEENKGGAIFGCEEVLENGAGSALYLRCVNADSLGSDDMGLKSWVCNHKLGVLVMIVLLLELIHYLLTASWLPWEWQ
jgi:hypothetical protein